MEYKEKLEVVKALQNCGVRQYRLALEEVEKDLDRLEKQDKILSILKNNTKLVDYKGNGSTQAFQTIVEDRFTIEADGEYVTYRNLDFEDIKGWLDEKEN